MTAAAPFITRFSAATDRVLERPAAWTLAICSLAVLQTALIFTHQPWPDELQALLIAQQAANAEQLLQWLRYEGHPPAWYGLLGALGWFVPPQFVLPLAALLCAMVVQGAIVFASPFGRSERLLLASSQYILFEFLTISRGTTLGAALLMLAMIGWRRRWLWIIIALLPTVDFLFGVISGVFIVLKWRERDLWLPGLALWLAVSCFAAWTIYPPPDMISASEALEMPSGLAVWWLMMGSLPLPFHGGFAPQWNTPVVPIAPIGGIVMLGLCWWLTRSFPLHRLLILGFFGFTLAFSLAVYPIGVRHLLLGPQLLILLVWLQRRKGAARDPVFIWWLVVLALSGLATSTISAVKGFDSGAAVVAEIERRGLAGKHWIALPEWRAPAVTGRSNIVFGRPEGSCRFTFVRWDHKSSALRSRAALEAMLLDHTARYGRSYLFSDRKFAGINPDILSPITTIPAGYSGISYTLYVVGRQHLEKPVVLPACADGVHSQVQRSSLGKN